MGKLIEGFWDCPFCGHKKIGGLTTVCPNCNTARGQNVTFYMADSKNYIDDSVAKTINRNPDWLCSFCDTLNNDDLDTCRVCGASKVESKLNYFENKEKQQKHSKKVDSAYKTSNSEINLEKNINKTNTVSKEDEIEFPVKNNKNSYSNTHPSKNVFSKFNNRAIKITAIVLAVVLSISALVWLLVPKTQEGVVEGFSWERSISVEEYKTFEESDWVLPSGARLLYTKDEIRTYERVIDHYETKTRTYTEEVFDHMDTVVVGHRDNGNGTFEEITQNVPVYRTETRTETYEEPVYREDPVYDTKYYYEIDRWTHKEYVKTSGTDKKPYWGEYEYGKKEREGTKNETYYIEVLNSKKENKKYSIKYDTWNTLQKGNTVKLKVYINGYAELITE